MIAWLQRLVATYWKGAQSVATPDFKADPELQARVKTLRQANALQALRDQVSDLYLDPLQPMPPWTRHSIKVSATVIAVFFVWAAIAKLDEVTTGIGKVVPSSREQIVQAAEAGVISEFLVHEGDVVEVGQPLLRIDDVKLGATMQESQARIDALEAAAARLRAEGHGGAPQFPPELSRRNPGVVKSELDALTARRQSLDSTLSGLQQSLKLATDELAMTEPLAAKGLVSDIDVLRLRRTVAELRSRIGETTSKFRADASTELGRIEADLGTQNATLTGKADSFKRAVLRAPKRGVVKNMRVTTVGGVVQAGQDVLEIVPVGETLLIETRIRPADIAFLRPGLKAIVKITAYDSGIYGWLDGELIQISADTLRDDVRREETYYKAMVRTTNAELKTPNGRVLPIIPGMQASVDIKTGEKSVLAYLFKPVFRAREALRER
ncbi:MAG TPA: HlyD family efflux transporter periplasmic adaptor subunit [Rhodocyclaceae bacterium]|nr:HlyD family efflux transporter periplasmic adaptor subunit [Rhodocyclaceae bacterium]